MSVSAANITESAEVASPDTRGRSRKKLSFSIIIGGTIVAVVVLAAVVSFVWTPYDPLQVNADARFLPPSSAHWLAGCRSFTVWWSSWASHSCSSSFAHRSPPRWRC